MKPILYNIPKYFLTTIPNTEMLTPILMEKHIQPSYRLIFQNLTEVDILYIKLLGYDIIPTAETWQEFVHLYLNNKGELRR